MPPTRFLAMPEALLKPYGRGDLDADGLARQRDEVAYAHPRPARNDHCLWALARASAKFPQTM